MNATGLGITYGQADEAEISDRLRRHDCCSRVGIGVWMRKFKTLWNDDEVKELQEQLHQQHAAISTLVGLLQM